MPVLGIVGRRVRDVQDPAFFPKPDNVQQGEETSQLFAALKAEGVGSILSVTLHLARDEE